MDADEKNKSFGKGEAFERTEEDAVGSVNRSPQDLEATPEVDEAPQTRRPFVVALASAPVVVIVSVLLLRKYGDTTSVGLFATSLLVIASVLALIGAVYEIWTVRAEHPNGGIDYLRAAGMGGSALTPLAVIAALM